MSRVESDSTPLTESDHLDEIHDEQWAGRQSQENAELLHEYGLESEKQFVHTTDNYLPWSVMNCLVCNVLLGLLAIAYSVRSTTSLNRGKFTEAYHHALVAHRINVVTTVLGFIMYLTLYLVYILTELLDAH